MKKEAIDIEKLSYEEAYEELLDITKSLETEEISLDDTMKNFERGKILIKHCETLLSQAEIKIKTIDGENLVGKDNVENGS